LTAQPINVLINGQPRAFAPPASIADVLEELEISLRGVAVELNLQVVPRARHLEQLLADGDRLEIVSLVGGG
jgi:sulfur carrier protein